MQNTQFDTFMDPKAPMVVLVIGGGHPNNLGGGVRKVLEQYGHTVYVMDINFQGSVDAGLPMENCITGSTIIYDDLLRTMQTIKDREGRLDGLVNSAGANLLGDIDTYPEDFWDATIDMDLKGPMLAIKAYVNTFGNQTGTKTVVNVGSNTSFIPRTRTFAYGAAKSGLVHMTRCLARELAPRKFAVINFDIGIVDGTPMHRKTHADLLEQRGWSEEETNKTRLSNVPWKRYSNPIEAGMWIKFLLEFGEYSTGNSIRIDGAEK